MGRHIKKALLVFTMTLMFVFGVDSTITKIVTVKPSIETVTVDSRNHNLINDIEMLKSEETEPSVPGVTKPNSRNITSMILSVLAAVSLIILGGYSYFKKKK